jgi:hypothetical protein
MASRHARPTLRCQTCAAPLGAAYFVVHVARGHLECCRVCLEDTLARWDVEAARQLAELEAAWALPFSATGPEDDDAGDLVNP